MFNDSSATSMSITLANNAQYILSNQTNFWSGDLFSWPLIFCLATIKWISFVLRAPDLSKRWNFFLVSYQLEMLTKQFFSCYSAVWSWLSNACDEWRKFASEQCTKSCCWLMKRHEFCGSFARFFHFSCVEWNKLFFSNLIDSWKSDRHTQKSKLS